MYQLPCLWAALLSIPVRYLFYWVQYLLATPCVKCEQNARELSREVVPLIV